VAFISVLLASQSRKADHSASLSLCLLLINTGDSYKQPPPTRGFSGDIVRHLMSFGNI
jgi:hypothetical protein